MILGIDPGKQGALAWITQDGAFVDALMVATRPKERGSTKRIYDEAAMWRQLQAHGRPLLVVLERTQARPGISGTACHGMGLSEGLWQGLLGAAGYPWASVRPNAWKRKLHGPKAHPEAIALQAGRRWPEVARDAGIKSHWGVCDALWLAEYGRQFIYAPGAPKE